MSYDPQKSRVLFAAVPGFNGHPSWDIISRLADQLKEAEQDIRLNILRDSDTRAEVTESQRRLVAEEQAHLATKTRMSAEISIEKLQKDILLAGLNLIKADARSTKKVATETLDKVAKTE